MQQSVPWERARQLLDDVLRHAVILALATALCNGSIDATPPNSAGGLKPNFHYRIAETLHWIKNAKRKEKPWSLEVPGQTESAKWRGDWFWRERRRGWSVSRRRSWFGNGGFERRNGRSLENSAASRCHRWKQIDNRRNGVKVKGRINYCRV